ncbi:vitamin K epoxide reductase family protein [soil metagenome]
MTAIDIFSRPSLAKVLPYILLIGSLIGLLAAFVLTYDKIQVLQDSSYIPSCNINPVLSCGSVMEKPQASLFGVPNTIFGLMGFSVLATLSALLIMGVKLPRRVWQGIQLGVIGGMIFTLYLFFQGVFRIGAICPFCFLIWITMPVMFWYTTLYNLKNKHVSAPAKVRNFLIDHHLDILILWYLIFFGILLQHFWYYWSTLI